MQGSTYETTKTQEAPALEAQWLALPALPGLPDPMTLFALLGTWHRRSVHVGFPELTADRP